MKTRSKFLASIGCIAATLIIAALIGCTAQQTAAELITTVGGAVASLEAIEGNTAIVAQIQKDTAVAAQAVENWKSGTPSQDIVAVLNTVRDDLYLVPVSTVDQALVDIAISAIEEIIVQVGGTPAATTAAAQPMSRSPRIVPAATKIKSSKDFKGAWNKLIAQQPKLAAASIK